MRNSRLAVAAITLTTFLAAGAAGADPWDDRGDRGNRRGNSENACAEAARALVHQETRWNERGRERDGSSGTLYWQAADGTQGSCLMDRDGRIYLVRVDRWGSGDISVWPGTGRGDQNQLVRCESYGEQHEECSIPRGSRVRLFDQLSNTPCVQNRNWGYQRDQLWVDDGCRGIFEVSW